MRTSTRRKPGPVPLPRRRLNQPAFYDSVRYCGHPGWLVALTAGLTHGTVLSALVTADSVPDTPQNIDRLERIADAVGFDRALIFLDGAR